MGPPGSYGTPAPVRPPAPVAPPSSSSPAPVAAPAPVPHPVVPTKVVPDGLGQLVKHPASNPAGLYGMEAMWGAPAPPPREATPPPQVQRLPGYLEEAVKVTQVDKLVYGSGATRDAGGVLGIGLPKLSANQGALLQRAKKYAMEVSIKLVLMKQTMAHQQQQTKYLQRQQAVSIMSRIYVGCINYDTKEDSIKTAFLPFGPIRSITMSWDAMTGKHKGFAFVEFEQPEAAQLALDQMNGILVCQRNIKVGRPSQMPQAQACIDEIMNEAKEYNRLYLASIHRDLTEEDIRSVFSAFGTIKECDMSKYPPGMEQQKYNELHKNSASSGQRKYFPW